MVAIQMATGSGKTYTAITSIYRLLKHANAKRILFPHLRLLPQERRQRIYTRKGRCRHEVYVIETHRRGHPPHPLPARGDAASRASRARTRRPRHDIDRGPTPAGIAGGTADSAPTAARARRETRDRSSGRRARPSCGPATPKKPPELLFDEPRQALPVAETRGLGPKGLEVIAHHSIDCPMSRAPGFVARRKGGHAKPAGGRCASGGDAESRQFGRPRQRRRQFLPTPNAASPTSSASAWRRR